MGWTAQTEPSVTTCPYCKRPIARVGPGGKLHPHKTKPTRASHDMGKAYRLEYDRKALSG